MKAINKCNIWAIMLVAIMIIGLASCSKEETNSQVFNMLLGSWKHIKWVYYNDDDELIEDQEDTLGESYLTFTDEPYDGTGDSYVYYDDYISYKGTSSWRNRWKLIGNYLDCISDQGDVFKITGSELQLKYPNSNGGGYFISHYRRTLEPSHNFSDNNVGGGSGGGGSTGDAPEVTGFDFTATTNTIKVVFETTSRAKSASIYYGESSPTKSAVDMSITSKSVVGWARGLKAGTKYYFKITVKNEYGSTTSDGWPATTLY